MIVDSMSEQRPALEQEVPQHCEGLQRRGEPEHGAVQDVVVDPGEYLPDDQNDEQAEREGYGRPHQGGRAVRPHRDDGVRAPS